MFVIRKIRVFGTIIGKKRMFVKIFNGCSKRQRQAHFYVRNWIIVTDVRKRNDWVFGMKI